MVVFLEPHDDSNVREICTHLVSAGWEVAIVDLAAVQRIFYDDAAPMTTPRAAPRVGPNEDSPSLAEESDGAPGMHLSRSRASSTGEHGARVGTNAASHVLSPSSLFQSLPIGQVFQSNASGNEQQRSGRRSQDRAVSAGRSRRSASVGRRGSADRGGALLPDDVLRSNDIEVPAGDFDEFAVDFLKLHRAMRVVASLDFVLIFTPYDEANYILCQAIFDHLPRYRRPHVVMSIMDTSWDEALHELSPPPIQMVPSVAVAQFLTNTVAPLGRHAGAGSLFDMTSARELGGSTIDASKTMPASLAATKPITGVRGGDIPASESSCFPLPDADAVRARTRAPSPIRARSRSLIAQQNGVGGAPTRDRMLRRSTVTYSSGLGIGESPMSSAVNRTRQMRRGDSSRDFSDWLRVNSSRRASLTPSMVCQDELTHFETREEHEPFPQSQPTTPEPVVAEENVAPAPSIEGGLGAQQVAFAPPASENLVASQQGSEVAPASVGHIVAQGRGGACATKSGDLAEAAAPAGFDVML